RGKLENIRLAIVDIGQAQGAGLPAGVSQAGAADVDRQYVRFRKSQRAVDRMRTGAATGDQDVDADSRLRPRYRHDVQAVAQEIDHRGRLDLRHRGPSRVGAFLVLLANLQRDGVIDWRQRGNFSAIGFFLKRLANL